MLPASGPPAGTVADAQLARPAEGVVEVWGVEAGWGQLELLEEGVGGGWGGG